MVTEALRRGPGQMTAAESRRKPYRIAPHDGGGCRVDNLDCIEDALSVAAGDDHK